MNPHEPHCNRIHAPGSACNNFSTVRREQHPDQQALKAALEATRLNGPLARYLYEVDAMTEQKNEGYAGTPTEGYDRWANYRGATAFGLSALDSALARFNEKHNRAAVLYSRRGKDRVGEGLRETLMDAAAIALIAVALIDEKEHEG